MTEALSLTLAEVYALAADLDPISLNYVAAPLNPNWSIGLRHCSDIPTVEARIKALDIRYTVADERRDMGRFYKGTVQSTIWGGPGCGWLITHVCHSQTSCWTAEPVAEVAEPVQHDLFGGES